MRPLERLSNTFYITNIIVCINIYLTGQCLRSVDGNSSPFMGPYCYEWTKKKWSKICFYQLL